MDLFIDLCLCLVIFSGAAFSQQSGSNFIKKIVREDEDAFLDCALDGTDITDEVFDWKKDDDTEVFFYTKGSHYSNGLMGQDPHFQNRVYHFPEQLAVGNASIVIRKAQVKDSGTYICKFPFHEPEIRAQFELTVGAARKPIISINKTNNGALIQCEVERAFPKPRVEWLDSSGNVLSAESRFIQKDISFDVFLQTTVTKSGFYRCVATQEKIHNQVFTETFVSVPVSDLIIIGIAAVVGMVVLVAIVAGIVLGCKRCKPVTADSAY